jgi:hypothetical protein
VEALSGNGSVCGNDSIQFNFFGQGNYIVQLRATKIGRYFKEDGSCYRIRALDADEMREDLPKGFFIL